MATKIVTHPIKDNSLIIENKEYTGLGVAKIVVGVENVNRTEIIVNNDGYNEARNAVEAQEIYCLKTQKHRPWFILDLETGSRGWFPGCIIRGTVEGTDVPIKKAPSDDSDTWGVISKAVVKILDIRAIDEEPYDDGWYKILYDVEGYIKKEYITNLRYENPLGI